MDLVEIRKKVEEKDRKRQQLIGQKEQIEKDLKEFGFDSLEEAESQLIIEEKELEAQQKNYDKGVSVFIEKFSKLLEN